VTTNAVSAPSAAVPTAMHLGANDLPFVDIGSGSKLKVIQVDAAQELWIVENIFQAGYVVQTHRHTGPVYAYTLSGAWKYQEYPEVNRAGSFLFEPIGSTHTLEAIEDNTQVWFHMYGKNLNLDDQGNVVGQVDGPGSLSAYYALCEAAGLPRPSVLVS
jgi:2,4'-dihydroxyacetophenone dioxygenase